MCYTMKGNEDTKDHFGLGSEIAPEVCPLPLPFAALGGNVYGTPLRRAERRSTASVNPQISVSGMQTSLGQRNIKKAKLFAHVS